MIRNPPKAPKALIFLDFDGVLVPWARGRGLGLTAAPACVAALNTLLLTTRAVIVVSSSWRGDDVVEMARLLQQWGVRGHVLGVTPRLAPWQSRGEEIQAWLAAHAATGMPYVVLDDEYHGLDGVEGHLVQTDRARGLTAIEAEQARLLLQRATA